MTKKQKQILLCLSLAKEAIERAESQIGIIDSTLYNSIDAIAAHANDAFDIVESILFDK
jgi:hypothetical protein